MELTSPPFLRTPPFDPPSPFPHLHTHPSQWTSCYANDNVPRKFELGFAMDAAYYKGVGSTTAKATDKLTSILADMNMIYQFQMNIFLVAKETLLKKTASNSPSWNSGCVGIENHLTQLKGWAGSQTDLSAAGT